MGIIKQNNIVTKKKKHLMYGLNRLEMTEDRISELENSSIKYTQFEQEMKKENNRVSRTSGTLTKELIFIL